MDKPFSFLGFIFFKNPFFLWILFFISSVFLAYVPISLSLKLTLFILGIAAPFAMALRNNTQIQKPSNGLWEKETHPLPPILVWILVLSGGFFLRFYRLDSLSVWPVLDEGRNAFFSLGLSRHWDWNFFHDLSQMPPLYYWLQALFFKVMTPCLFTLWLFPALLSLAVWLTGYWAVRPFFSKWFSFLFLALLGTSFYPVYIGRFNHQAGLLVLWELLTCGVLGRFLNSKPSDRMKWGCGLGFCLGSGFYIYFSWPFVAAAIGMMLLLGRDKAKGTLFTLITGSALLTLAPLFIAALNQGFGSYLQSLWVGGEGTAGGWIYSSFSYLTGLFWGVNTERHAYKPFWGGFLNPFLTACFLLGLLELIRSKKEKTAKALWFLLALFLLPAFISKEIEMFRIVQIMPLLLVITVLGVQRLFVTFKKPYPAAGLILFFSLSTLVDFYHLSGPYHEINVKDLSHWSNYSKSVERWRAYGILQKRFNPAQPLCYLSEFDPYPFDRTLEVAVNSFNVNFNSGSPFEGIKDVGFIANVNLRPFLQKRFLDAELVPLSLVDPNSDEGLMLALIPVESHRTELVKWAEANQALKAENLLLLNLPLGKKRDGVLEALTRVNQSFKDDPFLETIYRNLAYINHSADRKFPEALDDLQKGIQRGYPSAYFYNELGGLLFALGEKEKAAMAFENAIHSEENDTPAMENLRQLKTNK